jgi:hypothetical protein
MNAALSVAVKRVRLGTIYPDALTSGQALDEVIGLVASASIQTCRSKPIRRHRWFRPGSGGALRQCKWVLAVHHHEAPDAIQDIVESGDGQLYGALYSMIFERLPVRRRVW